jgi:hypothetical protein
VPITDALLLPADVVLAPVGELAEAVRRRLGCQDGDFALTRPRLRAPSRIVDAQAASLLGEFGQPSTVAEALLRHCRKRGLEPLPALREAYPLLASLLDAGFLVSDGTGQADLRPGARQGEEVGGYEVLRCVQALDDVEVYQVRAAGPGAGGFSGCAALKIERTSAAGRCAAALAQEAVVLERLAGEVTPRLLASGVLDGRHYLVTEWCAGVDAATAAAELRDGGARDGTRSGLLALARAVAGAYAELHARGVIHGDVHPRNVLVAAAGTVRLLDFGLARCPPGQRRRLHSGRGGVAFFLEPEYARSVRAGRRPPPASSAGEQYAVAALLYLLLGGSHYRDFPLERGELLRQIAEEPPLPFAERGVPPWPGVERVLARALGKEPRDRFPSLAGLAAALAAVRLPARGPRRRQGRAATAAAAARAESPAGWGRRESHQPERLLARLLARYGPQAAASSEEPRLASVKNGAAGVACALYRIALAREDAALLAHSDLWAARAVAAARGRGDAAFYDESLGITEDRFGRVSPYHTASGCHAVAALIAHAQGDAAAQQRAVAAFLAAVRAPCAKLDLALGRSGVLLAAALLLDAAESARLPTATLAALRHLGGRLLAELWQELEGQPPLAAGGVNLGIAHGWSGWLYASLRWCRAAASPSPERLEERLGELADCALSWRRGLCWRWHQAPASAALSMPGWCNGSAGFVHLWTLAHEQLGEPRYALLAEGAAWNAWEEPGRDGSLCCGFSGRAYALLEVHRHGGGAVWLARARTLGERAAAAALSSSRPGSLYRGGLGAAVLAADLGRPEGAVMPFFGDEGWRARWLAVTSPLTI